MCLKSHDSYTQQSVPFLSTITFLQLDPTLTVTNLWSVLCGVTDWWGRGELCDWLQVPDSLQQEIQQQTSDATQQKKTLLERWLRDYPAPSWAVVAEALYKTEEHDALEHVKKMYMYITSMLGWQDLCVVI